MERLWRPMEVHISEGRRVGDSRGLRESKEIGETVETNGDVHQQRKKSKRQ